jgi:hypothetical protein
MDVIASQITGLLSGNSGSVNSAGTFIPGDLANRQSQTAQWFAQAGLTTDDINTVTVNTLLDVPSGWQANITAYIAQISQLKASGQKTANIQYSIAPNAGLTGTVSLTPVTTTPGISSGVILLIGGLGLLWFVTKSKGLK